MAHDTAMPPALFDLEPELSLQEAHEGLATAFTKRLQQAGACASAVWRWHDAPGPSPLSPEPFNRLYLGHQCLQDLGHGGVHKCARCDQTWNHA